MPLERLRRTLIDLLGGVRVGEELAGWTLVHVDVDESMAFAFEKDGERIELALSPRDDGVPRFAQTASFNLSYSVSRLPGKSLGESARALLEEALNRIRSHDDGSARARLSVVQPADRKGEVREIDVESLLCPTTIGDQAYYTANPYVGCLIGCSFCYAQPRVAVIRKMAGFPDVAWGQYVTVKRNAATVLAAELARLPPRPVVFSPLVADVYQPVERQRELTRACLTVLAERGIQAYLLTRSDLVVRDIDVLSRIPEATVGCSIPTDRDDVGSAYEPRAATISERFAALQALRRAGIRTVAVLQPLLHLDVEHLADRLADVCDLVRIDVYRPPAMGGAPLVSKNPAIPAPPEDQAAVRDQLVEAVTRRGIRLWTTHVPM